MRDIIGFFLSLVCLLHCVGLPFLLPLLTQVGHGFEEESVHFALLAVVTVYTAVILWPQASSKIRLISGTGLMVLYSAMLVHGHSAESLLTVAGSLLLMASHMLNLRQGHSRADACADD